MQSPTYRPQNGNAVSRRLCNACGTITNAHTRNVSSASQKARPEEASGASCVMRVIESTSYSAAIVISMFAKTAVATVSECEYGGLKWRIVVWFSIGFNHSESSWFGMSYRCRAVFAMSQALFHVWITNPIAPYRYIVLGLVNHVVHQPKNLLSFIILSSTFPPHCCAHLHSCGILPVHAQSPPCQQSGPPIGKWKSWRMKFLPPPYTCQVHAKDPRYIRKPCGCRRVVK